MTAQTQTDRVRAALYSHPEGITQYDFSGPQVVDGLDRIMRVAARILELKKAGVPIAKAGRRDGHDVYRLEQDSGVGLARQSAVGGGEADTGTLFKLDPVSNRPLGAYEADAA